MTFPVPKDVRGVRDFEIIRGVLEVLREDVQIKTTSEIFDFGEPVKFEVNSGVRQVLKIDSGDTTQVPGAKICWTLKRNDAYTGQTDVLATRNLTVLSGVFQAATNLYGVGGGSYDPGDILIARWDGTNSRGQLFGIAAASVTIAQYAAAVGRVIGVFADGRLYFESMGY